MKITAVDTFVIDVPQKEPVAPYQSRYIATSRTGAILVRLQTSSGHVGWGEAPQKLPLGDTHFEGGAGFHGNEAIAIRSRLIGKNACDFEWLYVDAGFDGTYLQSAIEMAMWDVVGKAADLPLFQLFGGLYRDEIELAACLGIRSPAESARIAKQFVGQGYSTLKLKGGRDPAEDLAIVHAIRDAVGCKLRLRLDPNMGYQPDVCLQLASDLEPYQLEYFEQPMGDDCVADSARIRKLTTTPMALNESVTSLSRVREILELDAAEILLPDTYQCGGLRAVRQVADLAATAGVRCVFHCAHDFGLKTAAMLHIAASCANFPLANDCTYYGLVDDILTEPHPITRGKMRVPVRPGLGVDVDLARVKKWCVRSTETL